MFCVWMCVRESYCVIVRKCLGARRLQIMSSYEQYEGISKKEERSQAKGKTSDDPQRSLDASVRPAALYYLLWNIV